MLMQEFSDAVRRVREKHSQFLMVGRRWDVEINTPLSLGNKDWQPQLRGRVVRNARRRGPEWIDYFAFARGQTSHGHAHGPAHGNSAMAAEERQHLRSRDLHAYLTQWKTAQEHDGFLLESPGPWKYFRHLLNHAWTYGEIMTPRHRIYL
jgi:hypothetical protein